jgi:hypothetical protein
VIPVVAFVVSFVLIWLLVHGRVMAAAVLALLALPGVLLAARRR